MILGTQWYILFNVIAGAAAIPAELRAVGDNFARARLAVVAAHRAAGGVALLRDRRDHGVRRLVERQHRRRGRVLGRRAPASRTGSAPISREQTDAGDFHRIVLGIAVMSLFVVVVNRVFWRPLYYYAERKFRLRLRDRHVMNAADSASRYSRAAPDFPARRRRRASGARRRRSAARRRARSSACSAAPAPANRRCCA